MTRDAIETWLNGRTPARPGALAAEMTASVNNCPDHVLAGLFTMAESMGALGLATLSRVAAGEPASPQLAMKLLAADAFVTYAFEAAAEEGVEVTLLALSLLKAAA